MIFTMNYIEQISPPFYGRIFWATQKNRLYVELDMSAIGGAQIIPHNMTENGIQCEEKTIEGNKKRANGTMNEAEMCIIVIQLKWL